MKRNSKALAVIVAFLCLAILVSCAGNGENENTSATTPATTAAGTVQTEGTTAAIEATEATGTTEVAGTTAGTIAATVVTTADGDDTAPDIFTPIS